MTRPIIVFVPCGKKPLLGSIRASKNLSGVRVHSNFVSAESSTLNEKAYPSVISGGGGGLQAAGTPVTVL